MKLSLRTYLQTFFSDKYINNTLQNLTIDNIKYLQQFFKRWAIIFRSINKTDLLELLLKIDVHAPDMIRVNAPLSHINEYYIIYNVTPKDNNYLYPFERSKFFDFI